MSKKASNKLNSNNIDNSNNKDDDDTVESEDDDDSTSNLNTNEYDDIDDIDGNDISDILGSTEPDDEESISTQTNTISNNNNINNLGEAYLNKYYAIDKDNKDETYAAVPVSNGKADNNKNISNSTTSTSNNTNTVSSALPYPLQSSPISLPSINKVNILPMYSNIFDKNDTSTISSLRQQRLPNLQIESSSSNNNTPRSISPNSVQLPSSSAYLTHISPTTSNNKSYQYNYNSNSNVFPILKPTTPSSRQRVSNMGSFVFGSNNNSNTQHSNNQFKTISNVSIRAAVPISASNNNSNIYQQQSSHNYQQRNINNNNNNTNNTNSNNSNNSNNSRYIHQRERSGSLNKSPSAPILFPMNNNTNTNTNNISSSTSKFSTNNQNTNRNQGPLVPPLGISDRRINNINTNTSQQQSQHQQSSDNTDNDHESLTRYSVAFASRPKVQRTPISSAFAEPGEFDR